MFIKAQLGMVIPCTQFSWDMKSHQVSKNHLWRVRVREDRGKNTFYLDSSISFGGKYQETNSPKLKRPCSAHTGSASKTAQESIQGMNPLQIQEDATNHVGKYGQSR